MADPERFSAAYKTELLLSLPQAVQDALGELSKALGGRLLVPVFWADTHVAVAFDVDVDLPMRGPVGGIDIRRVEPVLVVFHRANYPFAAPSAYSDRKDFPAHRLPHLNPTRPDQPFCLCLHRGSLNDWFAEHTLAQFVERIRGWLRDAAANRLMRDGDFFEHTRLTDASAVVVFDTATFEDPVTASWAAVSDQPGCAFFHATVAKGDQTGWDNAFACHVDYVLTDGPTDEVVKRIATWNDFPARVRHFELWTVGILLWPSKTVSETYFGHLPATYGELVEFAEALGTSLHQAMAEYANRDAKQSALIPVTIAVLRPRPLMGTASYIEWLSFLILTDDENWLEQGEPRPEAKVFPMGHRRPLTSSFAAELSGHGTVPSGLRRPMIVGAGALGSRLSLHLAKGGAPNQLLVDHATLTPHHLVRHGLLARHLGTNKAEALRLEIVDMYRGTSGIKPSAHPTSAFNVLRDEKFVAEASFLIDASASASVLDALVRAQLRVPVCRGEIADSGQLGILSIEGLNRNPRLDDLQVHLWNLATTEPAVGRWLARHREEAEGTRGPALEEIGIGIGCSSATMRLSDDIVAHHAAQVSAGIRRFAGEPRDGGRLRLSRWEEGRALETLDLRVPAVRLLHPKNAHGWELRMSRATDHFIQQELHRSGRRETGGLLVGYVHKKRKIVYVTRALGPSPDSYGTANIFVRGVEGYTEEVRAIEAATGGLIGYVGEWHTHPDGKPEPSHRDRQAVEATRAALAPAGLPTVMVIAAARGTKAYLYE